ncbi:MAG: hypothetical protein LBF44_01330 [Holosporaceae bacterium]|jgi:hypothetical protein|nr:hypothetical protein [Holosporaceae bacterium]
MKKLLPLFFLISCSQYKTPSLPSLDEKSFSGEEILQKQKELKEKIRSLSENYKI